MKILLTSLLLWLALGPVRADSWPQYQHDPAHTGRTTATVTPEALHLIWSVPNYTQPLISGDTVYGTSTSGSTVTAFAMRTGAVKWSFSVSDFLQIHMAIDRNLAAVFGFDFHANSNTLIILDATTGAQQYSLPVGGSFAFTGPTLTRDPVSRSMTAYCATSETVTAVQLGSNSGRILWSGSGEFGGDPIPTIVGDSVVVAGPGQYYAFDRATGQANHFHAGDIVGGGGVTVAYDSSRSQFYVLEAYDTRRIAALTAYKYTDNEHIDQLWQIAGGILLAESGSVAIGADGKVYYCTPGKIAEVDPDTGLILRGVTGDFATNVTPALTEGVLWVFNQTQTLSYDLVSFGLIRTFDGSRGDLNTPYSSPGAFKQDFFVLDRLTQLDVYWGST